MTLTRRQFIKASAAMSAASAFPLIWWRARQAQALEACEMGVNLVIIQLEGGNDGVNMVIPMSDGTGNNRNVYDTLRPAIRIQVPDLVATQVGNDPLHNGELALHPHMVGLKALYGSGNLAVLTGVHYPNENLSHDISERIWYRADPPLTGSTFGWMGRTLDQLCTAQPLAVPAVDTRSELTPLFYGNTSVMAFDSLNDLVFPVNGNFDDMQTTDYRAAFDAIYTAAAGSGPNFTKPIGTQGAAAASKVDDYGTADPDLALNLNDLLDGTSNGTGGFGVLYGGDSFGLARRLRTVFALMKGKQPGNHALGCRVFRVDIGGFDLHSNSGLYDPSRTLLDKVQNGFNGDNHGELLHEVDAAISAFWQDCVDDGGLYKNTIIMTFSEFGRRIEENGDHDDKSGTDHGTAAPMFIVGPKAGESLGPSHLVGGMYGAYPELDALDDNGNLVFQLDFRHMYGEIISGWLGLSVATTNAVLGGGFSYTPQGFLV